MLVKFLCWLLGHRIWRIKTIEPSWFHDGRFIHYEPTQCCLRCGKPLNRTDKGLTE